MKIKMGRGKGVGMKKILLADPDRNITFILDKVLKSESYDVQSCNDCNHLLRLADKQLFDLLVVNSRLKMKDGGDLIGALQGTHPNAAFLIIHDQDFSKPVDIPEGVDQVRKPIDFNHIINRIKILCPPEEEQRLSVDGKLADYIQTACKMGVTTALQVKNDMRQGIIMIHQGKISYASAIYQGADAYRAVLSWKDAPIEEVKIKKIPPPNIDKDIQQLLLEAVVPVDNGEKAAAGPAAETVAPASVLHADRENYVAPDAHNGAPADTQVRKSFLPGYSGKSIAILALLVVGLFFGYRHFSRDEVQAEKLPAVTAADTTATHAPAPAPGKAGTAAGAETQQAQAKTDSAAGAGTPAVVPGKSDAGTAADAPQAAAAEGGADQVILRLHGSNTIGAKLAPALVVAYLQEKLHATDIETVPGAKENEQTVKAKLDGKPIAVEIQAHGSSTAFQDLKAGTCDIGDASRKIKDKEVEELGFLGDMTSISNEHVIGLDGIAVLVNKSNPVKQLSTENLQAIFSGKIADWHDINSPAGHIDVYSRDDKSGTYDTFNSIVLGDDHPLVSSARRYESNAELSDDVSRNSFGIGFTGLPYVRDSKALAVSEEGARPIYPNFFTVATEDYPISRRLYMYTALQPKNPYVEPFIRFVLSTEGQEVTQKADFIDMNIRSFYMDVAAEAGADASKSKVRHYLNAVKSAQRLSLNFRFKTGKTALDNRSVHDLDRIVSYLADKPKKKIILAGFADNSGNLDYNDQLATARAQLVAAELRGRGITVNDVLSCGQEMPVASNMTPQGKEKNRRVEVWLK
jgi:phosphate transport system substrate-binding protein